MKKIFQLAFILLLPTTMFAQEKNCIINVHIKDITTVYINGDSVAVRNGVATAQVSVDKHFGSLRVKKFEGIINPVETKTIYLEQGVIDITVTDKDSIFFATVIGPKWSTEYDEKLRLPVDRYNLRTHVLDMQLAKAKQESSSDTTRLYLAQNESIYQCFRVPQTYVKGNPYSPLCIVALNMLGHGDPIAKLNAKDIEVLFNSLPEATKSSPEGMAYAAKLQKMHK